MEVVDLRSSSDEQSSTWCSFSASALGTSSNPIFVDSASEHDGDEDIPMMQRDSNDKPPQPRQAFDCDDALSTICDDTLSTISIGSLKITMDDAGDQVQGACYTHRYATPGHRKRKIKKAPPPVFSHNEVVQRWQSEVNPKTATLRGLDSLEHLRMPRAEMVALITAIRDSQRSVIGACIPYTERLVTLIVGILGMYICLLTLCLLLVRRDLSARDNEAQGEQ